MTPRPDACRAGATALSHSATCGGGLYALTSTGGCASCRGTWPFFPYSVQSLADEVIE